ncbi:hypothetical protein F2P81_011857 [Scophthalmus maximus]|uniref:Uncharacterized protein n=1 Tax=Scophthalmus maximus TaxID=52904 RepID=A0A6A4SV28_SCOMX|nr:hypothetical protein F2P81_011857 [Scophthalmus maximus]
MQNSSRDSASPRYTPHLMVTCAINFELTFPSAVCLVTLCSTPRSPSARRRHQESADRASVSWLQRRCAPAGGSAAAASVHGAEHSSGSVRGAERLRGTGLGLEAAAAAPIPSVLPGSAAASCPLSPLRVPVAVRAPERRCRSGGGGEGSSLSGGKALCGSDKEHEAYSLVGIPPDPGRCRPDGGSTPSREDVRGEATRTGARRARQRAFPSGRYQCAFNPIITEARHCQRLQWRPGGVDTARVLNRSRRL